MRRMFAIPFISALLGGGVVVAVVAAVGGLGDSQQSVTTVQAAPIAPVNVIRLDDRGSRPFSVKEVTGTGGV